MPYSVVRAGAVEPGEMIQRRVSRSTGMDSVWEEVTDVRTRVATHRDRYGEIEFGATTTLVGTHGDMLSCDSNRRIMVRRIAGAIEHVPFPGEAEALIIPLPPLPPDVHQPIKRGS